MMSYSSMFCTLLDFAKAYHWSKFGGGCIPVLALYSETACSRVLDCLATSSEKRALDVRMGSSIGCSFIIIRVGAEMCHMLANVIMTPSITTKRYLSVILLTRIDEDRRSVIRFGVSTKMATIVSAASKYCVGNW